MKLILSQLLPLNVTWMGTLAKLKDPINCTDFVNIEIYLKEIWFQKLAAPRLAGCRSWLLALK